MTLISLALNLHGTTTHGIVGTPRSRSSNTLFKRLFQCEL